MELSKSSFPGFAKAMLRFCTAYKEEQFALADQRQVAIGRGSDEGVRPVAECGGFWPQGETISRASTRPPKNWQAQ